MPVAETPARTAVSPFPAVFQDVSLIVADDVAAQSVVDAVRDGAGELLEDVALFDVYTGPQIGEGRKSLTLALRFRAADRTLTEDEASAARDAAVAVAAERVGASSAPDRCQWSARARRYNEFATGVHNHAESTA